MTLWGEWQTVPAADLRPLETVRAAAALASLGRNTTWVEGLLGSVASPETARLLGATSAEEFVAALAALSCTGRLPELQERLATLERNAAEAAGRLGEGLAPPLPQAAFAPSEQHPAEVALLALARVASSRSDTAAAESEALAPQGVSIKLSPPRLDFSAERMAAVRAEGQGREKRRAGRGRGNR